MTALFRKEMGHYLKTPLGYLFLALFELLCGLLFAFYSVRGGGGASMYALLSGMRLPLLLIAPLLTMRLLAEEKRSKTDQLLLTSPLSIPAIVLGKALAALVMLALALLLSVFFPLLIAPYAHIDWGGTLSAYLGFFLMNAASLCLGVWMSAMCSNPMSAGVLTLGANLLMYLADVYVLPQLGYGFLSFLKEILGFLSLKERFASFQTGVMPVRNIVYFLCLSAAALILAGLSLETRREKKR